jgi:hypothetical protein
MNNDRELMQDALDALNNFDKGNHGMRWQVPLIKALRAALAQPEPEAKKYTEAICPVCGYYCLGKGGVNCIDKPKLCGIDTAPPQREWVGLTDDEIEDAGKLNVEGARMLPYSFARAIEAKLKEKNT